MKCNMHVNHKKENQYSSVRICVYGIHRKEIESYKFSTLQEVWIIVSCPRKSCFKSTALMPTYSNKYTNKQETTQGEVKISLYHIIT